MRKAEVAGTGALALPMIVTVDPADAQALTSPPPEPPGSSNLPELPGIDLVDSPNRGRSHDAGGGRTPTRVSGRTELPRTGADIDQMVAAGLAATAGGAALVLWSAHAESKSVAPGPTDPNRSPRRPASPAELVRAAAARQARLIAGGASRPPSSRSSRWARRHRWRSGNPRPLAGMPRARSRR